MRKNLGKDKAFAKDLTEFVDDIADRLSYVEDKKRRSEVTLNLKKSLEAFSAGDIIGLRDKLGGMRKLAAELDSTADHYSDYKDFVGTAPIQFSQYAMAERSKPFADRLAGITGRIAAAGPRKSRVGEIIVDILADFPVYASFVLMAAVVAGLGTCMSYALTGFEKEAFVAGVSPESITLENGKKFSNAADWPLQTGDFVIYVDPAPGNPDVYGARLYGRTADGSPVEIGSIREKTLEAERGSDKIAPEEQVVRRLGAREEMLLFVDNPNAAADALVAAEGKADPVAEALVILRRRVWELEQGR